MHLRMASSMRQFALAAGLAAAALVWAQSPVAGPVKVEDPWVRATVPGQQATGAFMKLTAQKDLKLVAGKTPVAPVVEIHEMVMEKDVMKMRAISGGLPLPAGKIVELKPGGYHVMLINLSQPIEAGQKVPLTLVFEDAQGQRHEVAVEAPVRALGAVGKMQRNDAPHGHDHRYEHTHDHKHGAQR